MFGPAPAQSQSVRPEAQRKYGSCLALLRSKPEDAFEMAIKWRDEGGGVPANHCAALALVELKQFAEAASRLEQLANDLRGDQIRLAPTIIGQAGNASLLADLPERAEAVFTAGLRADPDNVDITIDRARARAVQNNWPGVMEDLDQALRLAPDRPEAYALRAAAHRRTGNVARALEDADTALAIDGNDGPALYERGMARKAMGDIRGARADWVKIRQLEPNSLLSQAAGAAIEELDVKPGAPPRRSSAR
jgi:tetratricopeptide (TPR) repeat protein